MKFLVFFIFFLFLGGFFIVSEDKIHLNDSKELGLLFKSYTQWIDGLVLNSKTIGGYVVKMQWLPGNS
jgi:hypothetical protein